MHEARQATPEEVAEAAQTRPTPKRRQSDAGKAPAAAAAEPPAKRPRCAGCIMVAAALDACIVGRTACCGAGPPLFPWTMPAVKM